MPGTIPVDLIAESILSGRCVLLVGAGISSGCAPSTEELRKTLIDEIRKHDGAQAELAARGNEDLHRTAERLRRVDRHHGPGRLNRAFLRAFEAHLDDDVLNRLHIGAATGLRAGYGEIHSLIAEIPFRAIATTNYDTLLETAIYDATLLWPWCIAGDSDLSQPPNDQGQVDRTQIVKMHGCLNAIQRRIRVPTSIDRAELLDDYVLSTSQYAVFFRNRPLIACQLRLWFATRPLLILGYSMRDLNFQRILQEARQEDNMPPSWAIMNDPDPVDQSFWEERGVDIYAHDIQGFLEQLKRELLSQQIIPDAADLRRDLHDYWLRKQDGSFPVAVFAAVLKGEFDAEFVLGREEGDGKAEKQQRLSKWLHNGMLCHVYGLRGPCLTFSSGVRRGLLDHMTRSDAVGDRPSWEPSYDQVWRYWDERS